MLGGGPRALGALLEVGLLAVLLVGGLRALGLRWAPLGRLLLRSAGLADVAAAGPPAAAGSGTRVGLRALGAAMGLVGLLLPPGVAGVAGAGQAALDTEQSHV